MTYEEALEFITPLLALGDEVIHLLLLDPDFEAQFDESLRAIFWETRKYMQKRG